MVGLRVRVRGGVRAALHVLDRLACRLRHSAVDGEYDLVRVRVRVRVGVSG